MIVSVKIDGLSRLRKRLDRLKAMSGLDRLLREGAELVREEARDNLSRADVSQARAEELASSLKIRPTSEENGYAIETELAAAADFEFGALEVPETRWLGSAIEAKRRQIGEMARNYLQALLK